MPSKVNKETREIVISITKKYVTYYRVYSENKKMKFYSCRSLEDEYIPSCELEQIIRKIRTELDKYLLVDEIVESEPCYNNSILFTFK